MTLDANKKDEKLLTTIQQEYKILAEYKMVESEKLSGIYVIPSYANSLQWFGVIFGRQGVYADSVFRFTMHFPDDRSPPIIIFQCDVMHPHVCPVTHKLDISNAFPEWRMGEDRIWQVLKYMQSIFADPLESIRNIISKTQNTEAAELLANNREEYAARTRQCIEESKRHIYDTSPTKDPHYIVFEKFQTAVHGPILECIRSGNVTGGSGGGISQHSNDGMATGLSWVKEGEYKPLNIE